MGQQAPLLLSQWYLQLPTHAVTGLLLQLAGVQVTTYTMLYYTT